MAPRRRSVREKLETLREVSPTGCWLWLGKTDKDGYGCLGLPPLGDPNRDPRVHRAAYKIYVGPIPENLIVCHSCDVPRCFNPEHLFLGTQADNVADRVRKGRSRFAKGEDYNRKLKNEDVLEIRRLHGIEYQSSIAKKFGIAESMVSFIWNRKRWAHI